MKTCPYCAEEIQDAALKCKHCGTVLDSTGEAALSTEPALSEVIGITSGGKVTLKIKLMVGFLILFGIFALVLCLLCASDCSKAHQETDDANELKRLEKELKNSQDDLKRKGWTFDERGNPIPP